MPRLPFRAANAGVDGQDNHGHVGKEYALQRMRQTRQVLRRRRAHAETVQVLGAVAAHIVIRLAARLLNHNLAARAVGRRKLGAPANPVVRNLAHKLLNDVHGLRDLGATHLAAGIAIAIGSNDGSNAAKSA